MTKAAPTVTTIAQTQTPSAKTYHRTPEIMSLMKATKVDPSNLGPRDYAVIQKAMDAAVKEVCSLSQTQRAKQFGINFREGNVVAQYTLPVTIKIPLSELSGTSPTDEANTDEANTEGSKDWG